MAQGDVRGQPSPLLLQQGGARRCPLGAATPPPPVQPPRAALGGRAMLRCLFQPPEESRTRGGVGVQWGEGWGRLPWPPGLSPAPLFLSPLSPTHSLLLSPVSTYGFPLGSPSPAVPAQPPAAGDPLHGVGAGRCPQPLGAASGAGGGRRGLGAPQPLPIPGTAAAPPGETPALGRAAVPSRGDGSCSCGTDPEPVPGLGGGCGARGDPEPAAGTLRLSGELAEATTCSPHPVLPVPSVPCCCPPARP